MSFSNIGYNNKVLGLLLATGGDIAVDVPRRWLQKEGYMYKIQEKSTRNTHERSMTSACYLATHASLVHVVLTLMVPANKTH